MSTAQGFAGNLEREAGRSTNDVSAGTVRQAAKKLLELEQENERLRADVARLEQLTAAAPDLLAACVEFVRKCECGAARSKSSYAQMKAAIAKATGGN